MMRICDGIIRNSLATLREEYQGKQEPVVQISFAGVKDTHIVVLDLESAERLGKTLSELAAKF